MDEGLKQLIKSVEKRPGATDEDIQTLLSQLGGRLPQDYLDLLRFSDGIEGPVGNGYAILWPSGDVATANEEYQVGEFAPGLILIGSNGGNSAYGVDARSEEPATMSYVETDFIGMGWDAIFFRSATLLELLSHVASN